MVVSMERNIVIMLLCLLLANCAFLSKPAKATMYVGDVCKMRTGASGKCTIIQKCKTIDDALKERRMSTDDLVHCSFVGSDEVVCCPDPESTPDDKPTTTTKSGLIFEKSRKSQKEETSKPMEEEVEKEQNQVLLKPVPKEDFWIPFLSTTSTPSTSTTTTAPAKLEPKEDFWVPFLSTTPTPPPTTTTTTIAPAIVVGNLTLNKEAEFFDLSQMLGSRKIGNEKSMNMVALPQDSRAVNQWQNAPNSNLPIESQFQNVPVAGVANQWRRNLPTSPVANQWRNQPAPQVANQWPNAAPPPAANQWQNAAPPPAANQWQNVPPVANQWPNAAPPPAANQWQNAAPPPAANQWQNVPPVANQWPNAAPPSAANQWQNPQAPAAVPNQWRNARVPSIPFTTWQTANPPIGHWQNSLASGPASSQQIHKIPPGQLQMARNQALSGQIQTAPQIGNQQPFSRPHWGHNRHFPQFTHPAPSKGEHHNNNKPWKWEDRREQETQMIKSPPIDDPFAPFKFRPVADPMTEFQFRPGSNDNAIDTTSGQLTSQPQKSNQNTFSWESLQGPDGSPISDISSTKRTTLNNSSSSTVTPPGTDVKVGEERPAVTACRRLQQNLAPELTQHILDGIPADLGEFPHMVAIGFPQIGNDLNYTFDCGGTLVSDKFVLTAAHCLLDGRRQPKIVRLGKVAIHSMKSQDNTDAVDIGIRQIIAHPQYVSPQTYHDIALIELENTVTFTENIRPTCLHAELEDPPQNATLYVTGWGTVNTATRSVSGILLKAKLQISPIEQCNGSHVTYGLTRLNSRGVIAQQICAYDPEIRRDACQGDSGGPLQMVLDESLKSYSVVGIVASGFGCGTQTPGLYTRVAAYLDFIEQYVWPTR